MVEADEIGIGDEIEPLFGHAPKFAEGFGWQSCKDVDDEIVGESGPGGHRRRRRHRRHYDGVYGFAWVAGDDANCRGHKW